MLRIIKPIEVNPLHYPTTLQLQESKTIVLVSRLTKYKNEIACYLPESRDGIDVPVSHSGHGDHHPVDAGGDGGESRGLSLLYEVAEAGEAEAGDEDEHQHEAQLPEALSDGVNYGLEAGGVPAQLEDSGELEYSEHLTNIHTLLSKSRDGCL